MRAIGVYIAENLPRNFSQIKDRTIAADEAGTAMCLHSTRQAGSIGADNGMQQYTLGKVFGAQALKVGVEVHRRFT
jgi:hypothetical protein